MSSSTLFCAHTSLVSRFSPFLSLSLSLSSSYIPLSLALSLSLSHTHTPPDRTFLCTCGFCREIERSGRAHFIAVQCSRLLSSIVGESEKQVAAIFRQARQLAPCVLFLDQIECVAAKRSVEGGASGGARVGERVRATLYFSINYF